MRGWISFQVSARQFEERCGWLKPVFLQVNEGARELDEALVKIAVATLPVRQPQVFKHIMRLVKFLPVEQNEITRVTRIKLTPRSGKLVGHFGDAFALVHPPSLKPGRQAESLNSQVD